MLLEWHVQTPEYQKHTPEVAASTNIQWWVLKILSEEAIFPIIFMVTDKKANLKILQNSTY